MAARLDNLKTNAPETRGPADVLAADSAAGERLGAIRELAYLRAENRGFEPGHELEDWLAAEAEVKSRYGEN